MRIIKRILAFLECIIIMFSIISEYNIRKLTWKKLCCYDDYRNPTTFALELLNKYQNSNFVVDARNGFELV